MFEISKLISSSKEFLSLKILKFVFWNDRNRSKLTIEKKMVGIFQRFSVILIRKIRAFSTFCSLVHILQRPRYNRFELTKTRSKINVSIKNFTDYRVSPNEVAACFAKKHVPVVAKRTASANRYVWRNFRRRSYRGSYRKQTLHNKLSKIDRRTRWNCVVGSYVRTEKRG